jgi:AcrR family transcriptional regulator
MPDPARTAPNRDQQAPADDDAGRRPRGRPRRPATDAAILRATIDLLMEVGIGGTTTNAIVDRSGCSKSTIYRRWSTRDGLILDALRTVVRGRPDDIRLVVELEREMGSSVHAAAHRAAKGFQTKLFRAVFPTIARELLAGSAIGDQFRADIFAPIRAAAKARLLEAIEREELDPTVDRDLVFDLVYGGILYRLLLGEPVDDHVAHEVANLVMNGAAGKRYRRRAG